ncbi:hypothetical protein A3F66_00450 [candidate division TM6 bacterium RIFCSPHIGHO2_12_FULL_32_22]|nr:MAG: hypothetical protein A3F66_00450 [candidate division TM6 bacterium RIFCSPHIGHO2_12_FULL_32_22]
MQFIKEFIWSNCRTSLFFIFLNLLAPCGHDIPIPPDGCPSGYECSSSTKSAGSTIARNAVLCEMDMCVPCKD